MDRFRVSHRRLGRKYILFGIAISLSFSLHIILFAKIPLFLCYSFYILLFGARGSVVVKSLCYKPEGRGFDTRRGDFLNLPNPSGRTRPWSLLSL
jgi:hypothetical protein